MKTDFPRIRRKHLTTLQVNITLRCNQACVHCHVDAGPKRTEMMSDEVIQHIIQYLTQHDIKTLDITGGAPELHPKFQYLVKKARELDIEVIDRCNLTILLEPGFEGLSEFLAQHNVEIVASLPCYSEQNVDQQRGKGVFDKSIIALQKLNQLGYGQAQTKRKLSLVYNPQSAVLPPEQKQLEKDYKQRLRNDFGIEFDELYVLCNMPINRFAKQLEHEGVLENYMQLLKNNYDENNLENIMCRSLISLDYQGYVYDCDFNQMLNLNIQKDKPLHIADLTEHNLFDSEIRVADHCYACTAGQGSSCGGALQ